MTTVQIRVRRVRGAEKKRGNYRLDIYKYADGIGDITPEDNTHYVPNRMAARELALSLYNLNKRASKRRISFAV